MPVIDVKNLSVDFKMDGKWLPAVSNVSFSVEKGEILALVGESGCGKSVSCMSLARLIPEPPARYSSGEIIFNSAEKPINILSLSKKELSKVRGAKIAYIFQEPSVSLNPVFRVGEQIAEAIILHRPDVKDINAELVSLLKQVGIPEPENRLRCFPHEMSGGMQQRIMIAMALASRPEVLIADEPTTALDVTIQAQILELLLKIGRETGMSIILVTHNLGIVAELADRVIVMYAGTMVESAPASELIRNPVHPYTKALLAAVPKLGHKDEALTCIPGSVPSPANFPQGCRFYGRCSLADSLSRDEKVLCSEKIPDREKISETHWAACRYCSKSQNAG